MNLTNQKPFIAGNWKMNKTIHEAVELVTKICNASSDLASEANMVVIPPFTALNAVHEILSGGKVQLGAQDVFWEENGAFTGEISPLMLKDAGCNYVVIGHSERRQYFNETNETVNRKIKAAIVKDIFPILCIGETLEERKKEETISKIATQLTEGLNGLGKKEIRNIIFAYEPIWAIGTGLTAAPSQAEEVHKFIRAKLAEKYGNDTASCAIILYGGSVKPSNTFSLLKEENVNGALVGGASLDAESFIEITKEAVKAYKEKK